MSIDCSFNEHRQTLTWCETTSARKEQSLQLGERLRKNYNIKIMKMYWVINPLICSLFRQRGRYVCIKRNRCPHLAGVIVPKSRWNAYSRSWVRWCPSAIPCRLASSRLFICCCTSGRLISALMAALRALDTLFYNVEERTICGSFLFYTPFAVHFQKISIYLCPNLFHYG